jgi:(p)ppGpp synthase/HD superfamily hydrolase
VSDIYFDHYKEVEALQENSSGNREANRKIMQNLNTELENSVKVLLTEDQKKIYASYLKQQKSKRGKQGGPQGKRQ